MIILKLLLILAIYLVFGGITRGYVEHRWPKKMNYSYHANRDIDENEAPKAFATIFWPVYWLFFWPFSKAEETTFSFIEKKAALQIKANKIRVADFKASKAQLEESNKELESAELELEKEIAKGL